MTKRKTLTDAQEKRIVEALTILKEVGIPIDDQTERRRVRLALALLAVANLTADKSWKDAAWWEGKTSHALTTRQIIAFWNAHYGQAVSSGSYDDVRRKDLILLVEAGLVTRSAGNPTANTNNPTRKYTVSPESSRILPSGRSPFGVNVLRQARH